MSPRTIYRWIVFLLAGGYAIRMALFGDDGAAFGPFRFLTVWALFLSFFCASRMIALEEGRSARRWEGLITMAMVLNTMVVLLFWRLYFADPASVTRDGALGDWHMEMYLHAAGPALQVFDGLVLHRAPAARGAWRRASLWLAGVIGVYVCWAELVVAPLNDTPSGGVTSGLPYRFLNDLEPGERAAFYMTNFAVAILFLATYVALATLLSRARQRPAAL